MLGDDDLLEILNQFRHKQMMLYAYGTVLPLIDFGHFSFVEGNLMSFLREKLSENKVQDYYDVFTYPLHNSFAQDQEEDLLRLIKEIYKEPWFKDIGSLTLKEIKENHPVFYTLLENHAKKHGWVYYGFIGPAYTELEFLDFIKQFIGKNKDPIGSLKEISNKREEIKKHREEYTKSLSPDPFNSMILGLAPKIVWAKPRRKDFQSMMYYHVEKLLRELASRLHLSLSQVRSLPLHILESALHAGKIDLAIPDAAFRFHIVLPTEDRGIAVLYGKEAEDFYAQSVKKSDVPHAHQVGGVKTIKGTTASRGNAKGAVKIINKPSDMDKMQQGDILVSVATTPSIVPAMKKAAAIITDEGGLTCHAAIVSRELGTPCIVGTKNASKTLKDGDRVEVDATKGLITILR